MNQERDPPSPDESERASKFDDTRSVTLFSASGVFKRTPSLERAAAELDGPEPGESLVSDGGADAAKPAGGPPSTRFPRDPLDSTISSDSHPLAPPANEAPSDDADPGGGPEEPRTKRARRFKALNVKKRIQEISESRRISAEAVAWALEDSDDLEGDPAQAFPRPPEVPSEPGSDSAAEALDPALRSSELWRVRSSQSSLRLASDVPLSGRPSSHGDRTYSQSSVYSQSFGTLDIEDYWEVEEDEVSGSRKRSAETRSVTVKRPSSVFKALTDTRSAQVVQPDPNSSKRLIAQIADEAAQSIKPDPARRRRRRRGKEPEDDPRLVQSLVLLALVLVLVIGGALLMGGPDPITETGGKASRRKVTGSTRETYGVVGDEDQTYYLPLRSSFVGGAPGGASGSGRRAGDPRQRLALRKRDMSLQERRSAVAELWLAASKDRKMFTAAVQLAGLGQLGVDEFTSHLIRVRPGEGDSRLAMELLSSIEREAESRAWVQLLKDSRGSLARVVEARVIERGELTTLEGCLEAIALSTSPSLPQSQRAATVALLDRFGVSGALELASDAEPERARLLYGLVAAVDPGRISSLIEDALRDAERRSWALDILRFSRRPIALNALHELLRQARGPLLIRVCRVLGSFGAAASVPPLIDRREGSGAQDRRPIDSALRAIARARGAVGGWQAWWSDAEADLQDLKGLCDGTRLATRQTRSRLGDLQRALRVGGPEVERLVLDLLTDRDPVLRDAAVRASGRLRIAAAAPRLARALSSRDREVIQASLVSLRAITGWSELGEDPAVWRRALRLEKGGR